MWSLSYVRSLSEKVCDANLSIWWFVFVIVLATSCFLVAVLTVGIELCICMVIKLRNKTLHSYVA